MQAVLQILMSLGMKLLAEPILKRVIVLGLEAVVARTENTEDDKLVAIVKEAWEID